MPRIAISYDEKADGDLKGRMERIRRVPNTFWSNRSDSAIAKELLKNGLDKVEAEVGLAGRPKSASR